MSNWELEDGSGNWEVEDGSGNWELEDGSGGTRPPVLLDRRCRHPRRRFPGHSSPPLRAPFLSVGNTPTAPHYGGVSGFAAVAGTPPRWMVRIVGLDYAKKAELVSVANGEWTERLNGFDELRFTISTADPAIAEFRVWTRWVELWLDGDIKFRGFPVRADLSVDAQTVTVQCFDQLYPFHRRVFGRADRKQYGTNGGFEDGLTGWTSNGGITATSETVGPINEGSKSAELSAGGYISQSIHVPPHTYPPGLMLRTACDYYIQSGASLASGVALEVLVTDPDTGVVTSSTTSTLDGSINTETVDGWQQVTADVLLSRHGVQYTIERRVYAPETGFAWADRVRTVFNDATTVPFPGADQAIVYRNVVQYGQDESEGQSHLGIGTDCAATGVTIYPAYKHAEHRPLMSAIDELTERTDAPDWDLVFLPAATNFKTYYPSKGSTRTEWEIGGNLQILSGSVDVDGSQTTTSAIVTGQNGDFERDEGGYADTSSMSGLVLTDVIRADVGSPVRFFDQRAEEHVDKRKALTALFRGWIADRDRAAIHDIDVGDVLYRRLDTGLVQVDGRAQVRVVEKRVPQSADRVYFVTTPA